MLPTTCNSISQNPILTAQKHPPLDNFKLNFGGSVKDFPTVIGVIIRNYRGELVAVKAFNLGNTNIMIAEAINS